MPLPAPKVIRYGDDPSQYGELNRPDGPSRGTVVLVHGGSWKAEYGLDLMVPAARDLAGRGWTVWNIEYRRLGNGGEGLGTFDDVAAAIDRLADIEGVDLDPVVAVGHSAGAHLAVWAAARERFDRWRPARVRLTHVVALAGLLDLGAAYDGLESSGEPNVVASLTGGAPGPAYDELDPARQLPLEAPVWLVHSPDDDDVGLAMSTTYAERARAAGADVELVEVTGDHMAVIDVDHSAWSATVEILDRLP